MYHKWDFENGWKMYAAMHTHPANDNGFSAADIGFAISENVNLYVFRFSSPTSGLLFTPSRYNELNTGGGSIYFNEIRDPYFEGEYNFNDFNRTALDDAVKAIPLEGLRR